MDVRVRRLGTSSLIAQCQCGWTRESDGTRKDDAATRAAARRHVISTGHTVSLQAVHTTHYAPQAD